MLHLQAFFANVAKARTVKTILQHCYGDKSAVTDELVQYVSMATNLLMPRTMAVFPSVGLQVCSFRPRTAAPLIAAPETCMLTGAHAVAPAGVEAGPGPGRCQSVPRVSQLQQRPAAGGAVRQSQGGQEVSLLCVSGARAGYWHQTKLLLPGKSLVMAPLWLCHAEACL